MLESSVEYFKYLVENSNCKSSVLSYAVNALKVSQIFIEINEMTNEKGRKLLIIADDPGMGKLLL